MERKMILIAMIEHLENHSNYAGAENVFPNLTKDKLPYYDSVIESSGIFKTFPCGNLITCWQIKSEYTADIHELGAEKFVEKHLREKQKPSTPVISYTDNSKHMNVTGGVGVQDSDLNNALNNPTIQNTVHNTDNAPKRKSPIEIISWIVAIIAGCLAIYEFIIKRMI